MSTEILFDTTGRRLTNKSDTKHESIENGIYGSDQKLAMTSQN